MNPGSRLGPYEVVSLLGAGGMGEVFRARDTRLNRDVALKILPEAFATDAERVARFTREAQTLAALNHPHIAQIYGLEAGTLVPPPGESPGGAQAPPTVRALVMELVEGEDLSQRLARGPLALDDAFPIARQIAEALQAAHEQGIIHRDLKPGNIKLRTDGTVKVLDFGLAKALDHSPASSVAGNVARDFSPANPVPSPTITTPAMTLQGVILGTAAYMSPEQAKGRLADQRSDVWAFGCVLFEMLTARRAFDGEDVSDTLAAVPRGEPDYAALPADTPPAVVTLIKRCLERDRRRRVGSLSTAIFVIDDASAFSPSPLSHQLDEAATTARVRAAVDEMRRTLIRKRFVPALGVVLLVAILAALLAWRFKPSEPPPLVARFALPVSQTSFAATGLGRSVLGISNDGTTIAFTAGRQLFVRPLADFVARVIHTADPSEPILHTPVFSPDDRVIAFFSGVSIKRISASGGAAATVCPVRQPWGMTWHATGLVIGQGSDGIIRCPSQGGAPEKLLAVQEGEIAHAPQIIPGDGLLFTIANAAAGIDMWDKADIVVHSLVSGTRKTIISGGTDARYVPSGHILYALSGVVYAVPFDVKRQEVTGPAVAVIEGVRRSGGVTSAAHFATSGNGTLTYVPGPITTNIVTYDVVTAERSGPVTRLPVRPGPYEHVRASRDGTHLALGSNDGREAIVWLYRLGANTPARRLTLIGRNRFPVWLPDGLRVAFQSDREGDAGIFAQRVDGTGNAERLTKAAAGELHIPNAWSPDGRVLLFEVNKGAEYTLWMLSTVDKQISPFPGVLSREPIGAVFSPDSRWIAYASNPNEGGIRSSNRGIFVQPFPPANATYQAPSDIFDFHPVWNPKGLELVYVPSATSAELSAVEVTVDSGVAFGTASKFPALVTGQRTSTRVRAWDLLSDGRLVGIAPASGDAGANEPELRVVLNWFEEIKARAPVRR